MMRNLLPISTIAIMISTIKDFIIAVILKESENLPWVSSKLKSGKYT